MERQGYSKYKHTYSILDDVLKTPGRREILFDYCNVQVEAYKDAKAAMQAKTFVDDSRNAQLVSMFSPVTTTAQDSYSVTGTKK